MRLKSLLIILAAIGLSSVTTGRATSRANTSLRAQSSPRVQTVRAFYSALIDEIAHGGYDDNERSLLHHPEDYYGRYLDQRSRDYVNWTVMPHIADAIRYFDLEARPRQRIFDLGCGLGMQSLIFASMGATVVGVDVREESVELCRKRKAYHEQRLGRALDVEFHHTDFGRADLDAFGGSFDALFSMSALSYVKPLDATARRASNLLKDDARIFLYEQNGAFALDGLKRTEPIPKPHEIIAAFEREGFVTDFLLGAGSIPWNLWRLPALNEALLAPANDLLRKQLRLSFKYVLGMKRSRDGIS